MNVKKLVLQLTLMLVVLVVILNLTMMALKRYTKSDEYVKVPLLIGKQFSEIQSEMQTDVFKVVVSDSVFNNQYTKGTVVDQIPPAELEVKSGRTIYVTLNALSSQLVSLPELKDISTSQASSALLSKGLKVGSISHAPSQYDGFVIRFTYKSVTKKKGDKVPKGAAIDLVIGKSSMPVDSLSNDSNAHE